MPQQYLLYNDIFHPLNTPIITAENRAFRFGDGLFESMRMIDGKLQFAELHADRLAAGMKALKIEGHSLMDAYFLKQKTTDLAKRNKWAGNARFRLAVYRAGAGLYTPEHNKNGYLLEGNVLPSSTYELNKKGLIVDLFTDLSKPINKFSSLKTANALLYVMAGLFKQQNSLDEAFILNEKGFLCESISANIFVVYDKKIYTPALTEGCVAGVMRSAVLHLSKINDIEIIEAEISPKILAEADEVFITNATKGLQWVMGYGRKRYFDKVAKLLSGKLNASLK
ncbi:branched-subunit amino acid aminotransferase/4-amino-4-deoxychorismate lyase [Pedobacter sp. UYP30]|uniref:aminotransferase class IV n=1 Tax=Pedobacter sp. UYP30 TaxID=1756400 RepID=UPI00339242EC